MRIVTFASGSTGNCGLITDGETNILYDAGISMRRTVSALKELGLTPQDLCGVLITHEHSDHISGLKMLCKHHNVKVFAPSTLCAALGEIYPEVSENLNTIPVSETFELGSLELRAFGTPHDARCSVGYRFTGEGGTIACCTDTGCITDEMYYGLEGADIALIEANHDIEMLRSGPYPYSLKRRILSDYGHLSNNDCGKLAFHLAKSGTKDIIVGHLSRENNTPQIAKNTVESCMSAENANIYVAPLKEKFELGIGDRV